LSANHIDKIAMEGNFKLRLILKRYGIIIIIIIIIIRSEMDIS